MIGKRKGRRKTRENKKEGARRGLAHDELFKLDLHSSRILENLQITGKK